MESISQLIHGQKLIVEPFFFSLSILLRFSQPVISINRFGYLWNHSEDTLFSIARSCFDKKYSEINGSIMISHLIVIAVSVRHFGRFWAQSLSAVIRNCLWLRACIKTNVHLISLSSISSPRWLRKSNIESGKCIYCAHIRTIMIWSQTEFDVNLTCYNRMA